MLCGYPPFNGENDNEILEAVKRGKFQFDDSDWEHITKEAQDLIKLMLNKDHINRISGEDCLLHPWLTNNIGRIKVSKRKA